MRLWTVAAYSAAVAERAAVDAAPGETMAPAGLVPPQQQPDTVSPGVTSARHAALTSAPLTANLSEVPRVELFWLTRAVGVVGEFLALVGIVFCIPFVIVGIGIPIALAVRFLLWVGRLL